MPMPVAPDYRESESFSQTKILISGQQSAPCICPKTREHHFLLPQQGIC